MAFIRCGGIAMIWPGFGFASEISLEKSVAEMKPRISSGITLGEFDGLLL